MKFLKIKNSEGGTIWINPSGISSIEVGTANSCIRLDTGIEILTKDNDFLGVIEED